MAETVLTHGRFRGWWRRGCALMLVVAATGLAACGQDAAEQPATPAAPNAEKGSFPVTVTDCGGRITTYEKAPERVVGLFEQGVEYLATLGLTDKVVGYARYVEDELVWPKYREELLKAPIIGSITANYPSQEVIVALQPDFVISPYVAAFAQTGNLPERDGWKEFGANAFLLTGDCSEDGGKEPQVDFDYLFTNTRELAKAFGVQDRAETVITEYRKRLDAVAAKVQGKKSLRMWNSSSSSSGKTARGSGGPSTFNAITTLAGATNIFGDFRESGVEVSFEEVVKRDPEVIVIVIDGGVEGGVPNEAEMIRDGILADKRLADVTAVKNKAFVTISYLEGGLASPRNIEGLESVVEQLEAFR